MHLTTAPRRVSVCCCCMRLIGSATLLLTLLMLPHTTLAGMLGYPAASQQPFHLRFELAGDSFKEDITGGPSDAEANSARALFTAALGLTEWSEIYVRLGVADFAVDEALFNGGVGPAYGGGIRLRLLQLPIGNLGLAGQYLRFTSDDSDSAGVSVKGAWEEIDIALGVGSRRYGPFQFYVGGAYHQAKMQLKVSGGRQTELETDIPFRLFFGANIFPLGDFPSGRFLVNIEARVIGETPQFTMGIQYAF
jgi:hypothetical protein